MYIISNIKLIQFVDLIIFKVNVHLIISNLRKFNHCSIYNYWFYLKYITQMYALKGGGADTVDKTCLETADHLGCVCNTLWTGLWDLVGINRRCLLLVLFCVSRESKLYASTHRTLLLAKPQSVLYDILHRLRYFRTIGNLLHYSGICCISWIRWVKCKVFCYSVVSYKRFFNA